MQTPGTIISGMGHTVLIGWLLLGWGLDSDPLEFDTMTVTTVSGEEFDALNAARTPDPGTAEPDAPVQPVLDEAPELPPQQEPTEVAPPPDPVEQPVDETPPPDPPQAPPVADVTDTAPSVPTAPAPAPPAPDLDVSEDPTPRQVDVVASTPTPPPPPDAAVDDAVRDEAVQEPDAEPEVVQDEQDATAPEETTTAIVNEDDTPSAPEEPVTVAPTTSVRPVVRPNRPAPAEESQVADVEESTADPEPTEPDVSVEDLLGQLDLEDSSPTPAVDAPAAPAGPPLTGSESDAFRVAVNRCWNVDPGSVAARVTVEVGFSLDQSGKVVGDQVNLLASDGDQRATNTAFEAARRAILRCQSGGYQLPADKYEHWKDVVITFDPSGMRLR